MSDTPKSAESDTPRTDSESRSPDGLFPHLMVVSSDFARQLERELATCREATMREAAEISKCFDSSLAADYAQGFYDDAKLQISRAILSEIDKKGVVV